MMKMNYQGTRAVSPAEGGRRGRLRSILTIALLALGVVRMWADGITYYYFAGKMGGKVSVEIAIQKLEDYDEGIVAGYILYPKAKNPAPILIVGHKTKNDWFHLSEYQSDGVVTGVLDFRIGDLDAPDGPNILEGEWTNPKTGAIFTLTTLKAPYNFGRMQMYQPKWLEDIPIDSYDGFENIGQKYCYERWNANYQSMMGGQVEFEPVGEGRLHFRVSNCWRNIAKGASATNRPAVVKSGEFSYPYVNECGYGFKCSFFKKFIVLETTSDSHSLNCFGMGASFDGVYIKVNEMPADEGKAFLEKFYKDGGACGFKPDFVRPYLTKNAEKFLHENYEYDDETGTGLATWLLYQDGSLNDVGSSKGVTVEHIGESTYKVTVRLETYEGICRYPVVFRLVRDGEQWAIDDLEIGKLELE